MVRYKHIIQAITDYTEKCDRTGPKATSGIITEKERISKYELNDGGLTKENLNSIADDMAERYGLEVSINDKGKREIGKTKFALWDDKHKTILNFDKIVKHQDWIDFTNNDKGKYNLDDVLRYYDELDNIAKDNIGGIFFSTEDGGSYYRIYDKAYDCGSAVVIGNHVYTSNDSTDDMRRIIGHEVGHGISNRLNGSDVEILRKSFISRNKFEASRLETSKEQDKLRGLLYSTDRKVSDTMEWVNSYEDNDVELASMYSSTTNDYCLRKEEDFAEVMSAVVYRNASPSEKELFRIRYDTGEEVGLDRFIKDHQGTYNFACDYVDGKIKWEDIDPRPHLPKKE